MLQLGLFSSLEVNVRGKGVEALRTFWSLGVGAKEPVSKDFLVQATLGMQAEAMGNYGSDIREWSRSTTQTLSDMPAPVPHQNDQTRLQPNREATRNPTYEKFCFIGTM